MAKDHKPSGFTRTNNYKSDLEIAETASDTKRINTSFGSQNHNVYVMNNNHTHEHFYYDPTTQKSGWHGSNYETKNNHPNWDRGENQMDRNSFLDSLKVDSDVVERCNEIGNNYANNINQMQNEVDDDGGRERCDDSLGRESGYKEDNSQSVESETIDNSNNANEVENTNTSSPDNNNGVDDDNGIDME